MITPLDIENKKFSKQMMNGYNVDEVDDFLDELSVDYSKNYKDVTELKAKVEELNKSLVQYKSIEETLQNTLVMAQSTAEDVKNVAKQQAEQIINEAKAEDCDILSLQASVYGEPVYKSLGFEEVSHIINYSIG